MEMQRNSDFFLASSWSFLRFHPNLCEKSYWTHLVHICYYEPHDVIRCNKWYPRLHEIFTGFHWISFESQCGISTKPLNYTRKHIENAFYRIFAGKYRVFADWILTFWTKEKRSQVAISNLETEIHWQTDCLIKSFTHELQLHAHNPHVPHTERVHSCQFTSAAWVWVISCLCDIHERERISIGTVSSAFEDNLSTKVVEKYSK